MIPRRWRLAMLNWLGAGYMRIERDEDDIDAIPIECPPDINMDKAIRFNLLPARGGVVFEIRTHDTKTHDWNTVTHIIPEGQDVAESVGKIVAMELLRH